MNKTEALAMIAALQAFIAGDGYGGGDWARPGMVKVRPTGVLAHGVERWYPAAQEGESLFTYGSRVGPLINPDSGQPYVPVWLQGSAIFSPTMGGQGLLGPGAAVPDLFDRILHPSDWATQADIDRQANLDATGEHFSPGR